MKNKFKIRFSLMELYFYFLLIPFFAPTGFNIYFDFYEKLFTMWLLCSSVLVCLHFITKSLTQKFMVKKCVFFLIVYYLIFIMLTLGMQGGIEEGLKKLFIAPVFALLYATFLDDYKKEILTCTSNIFIVIFFLSLMVFNSTIFPEFFTERIVFVGHVQVAAQMGLLGIYIALIFLSCEKEYKTKSLFLFFLSVLMMLQSKTIMAYITIAILMVSYVIYKVGLAKKLYLINPYMYIGGWIVLNVLLLLFSRTAHLSGLMKYFDATLSGRSFVWTEAINLIKARPVWGYGAFGVNIVVFWHEWINSGDGMNYAHNEFLQRLLDGGLVLLIMFIVLLISYCKYLNEMKNVKIRFISSACLICFLVISLIESVTEYYYILAFLSILAYYPNKDLNVKNAI